MPVLEQMPASHLRDTLVPAFSAHAEAFAAIETGFRRLTSGAHDAQTLRGFFQSWSQTNNSATTVAGISNRLTLRLHRQQPVADTDALLRTLTSLHRILDEDLAVTHRILHSQLFYTMATAIVGDDDWQSQRYLHPAAEDFKRWKDAQSLRDDDIMVALLTTLAHEIYTHGEVEFILPLFKRWLEQDLGIAPRDAAHILGWISVHCGPTEKNHFFHARDAVMHYAQAMALRVEDYRLDGIVATYLQKKAAVLTALFAQERAVAAPAVENPACNDALGLGFDSAA
jgi:hypothetical protein